MSLRKLSMTVEMEYGNWKMHYGNIFISSTYYLNF